MVTEIECSLYVYNPDHHSKVAEAEKFGYDVKPEDIGPKYLKMPFTFAPVDILAFYQDQTIEGCTIVFMHSTHFMIDYPYEALKRLRMKLITDMESKRTNEAR